MQSTTYTADFQPPSASSSNPSAAFYADSFADILMRSIGYYVTCEFLVGNSGLEEKSGYLYAAGVNFLTLHDPENQRYIICDLYSVKFVTIHANHVTEQPHYPNSTQRPSSSTSTYQPSQRRSNR